MQFIIISNDKKRCPEKYVQIRFPNKIPPQPVTIAIESLPLPGYLEQVGPR